MHLSPEDVLQFYKLMYALQFYVKEKRGLLPDVKTEDEYRKLDTQTKLSVRDAVYEHPELMDKFILQNPAAFSEEELAIIRTWRKFVKGEFFVERFLKKHSIWIGGGEPSRVFAVLGISEGLDEMIHPSYLPLRVRAVLLPWKGQIIYDGLFQPYTVFFGGGIKGDLRETYMTAKQNGRIVESLETASAQSQKAAVKVIKDWSAEAESLVQLANVFKGKNEPLHGEVFSLLKAVAALTQTVVDPQSDVDSIWNQFRKVQRAANKMETALYRAER